MQFNQIMVKKISKLLQITVTQVIAHHSVTLKTLYSNLKILQNDTLLLISGKYLKAIATVVYLIDMTKNCEDFSSVL